jgi:hypothetical protein
MSSRLTKDRSRRHSKATSRPAFLVSLALIVVPLVAKAWPL